MCGGAKRVWKGEGRTLCVYRPQMYTALQLIQKYSDLNVHAYAHGPLLPPSTCPRIFLSLDKDGARLTISSTTQASATTDVAHHAQRRMRHHHEGACRRRRGGTVDEAAAPMLL